VVHARGDNGRGSLSRFPQERLRRPAAVALGAACSLLVASPPALAAPQVDGVFPVTGLAIDNQITQGPDGNIWVTVDDGTGNDVARITPAGDVTKFNLDDVDAPVGITGLGNDLWVTAINEVARFAPGSTDATATTINEIGSPRHITVGPDGNLWAVSDNNVIKIPPGAPNTSTSFPGLITGARQVTAAPNGTLWATGGTQVINFTTAGTHVAGSPYELGGGPQGIAAGPAPQIAYGNPTTDPQSIGRITPPGPPDLTNLGNVDAGFGVTFANDGAYWFGQYNGNNLGRLTPDGAYTTLEGIPAVPNRGPRQITTGPGDTLWVTLDVPGDATNDAVARVTGVTPEPPPNGGPGNVGPANDFEFGKAKKNKEKGTATLTVIVPGPGDVALAATKKVKGDRESTPTGGDVKLEVKPKGKAKQKLQPEGKAKVTVEVTYTPTGGIPNTEDTKLKLVKRP
jgi:streptogramin lyase